MNSFTTIPKFKFWCQKILPLVYDDSLSYMELLCKVVDYLNKVIEDINNIPDYINEVVSEDKLKDILSELLDELREQIARANEGENTTASFNRDVDELVWLDGKLVRMTRAILAGDRYVEDDGTPDVTGNFVYTSVELELQRVKDSLASEINTREQNDTQLQSNINAEALTREQADTQLQGNIDAEELARQQADTQLQGNIDNEIHAREIADSAINTRIDNLDLSILLQPSGDTTGATDITNIQEAIDTYNYVLLDRGDFYINSAIGVKSGTTIIGVGNNLTKIHVTSDISAIVPKTDTTSVDNLTISNLYILGVEPTNSTHYALDFNFDYDNANYYGARYSLFENIDVRYFYGSFRGSQFWDTTFIKCRFSSANTDVRLRDAVNNVTFIQCAFSPDKYTLASVGDVPIGVGVFADNGERVECYNIAFYNCDCEHRSICYKMTTAIACGFYNCYNERVDEVFNFDSCPASVVIGGNTNFCNKIARVANSYSGDIYNGLITFKDLFVKVYESDIDNVYIIPTTAAGKVYVDNINIHNSGSGKCYLVTNDQNTFRTGQANATIVKQAVDLEGIRYSAQNYNAYLTNWGVTQTFKLLGINVLVRKTFTTTTTTKLQLYRGTTLLIELPIPAGTHSDGEVLTANVNSVTLINTNDFKFKLSDTVEVEMNIVGMIRGYLIEDGQNRIGTIAPVDIDN